MTHRHDIYRNIHKALRAFMFDTLQRIGRIDVDDPLDFEQGLQQTDALLALMSGHVEHENEFVHPALEARRPRAASRTADDHMEHLEAIAELGAELDQLRAAAPDRRQPRADHLYHRLALFVAENLQHMQVEETANNAVLWACYSDAELEALHQRLLAKVKPAAMRDSVAWMISALNPHELQALLGAMQAKMPPPVFAGVLELARERLSDTRWLRLNASLGPQHTSNAFTPAR